MKKFFMDKYDVIVIGAGHAGCEAALASARLGSKTAIFSINLDSIAMMPCNPSIGGTGKGHLVREIDALGGQMGLNIDRTFIQSRMLNTAKGPAVRSLRAQADKNLYHLEMKKTLEKQKNLDIRQEEIVEITIQEGRVTGVVTKIGSVYESKVVIICTGTFLRGKIFIGESNYSSGPNGLAPSITLSENLKALGLTLRRFKTGTPARALSSTFDYTKMQEQKGDERITPFSFMTDDIGENKISCWLTYTNAKTHEVIRQNFHRSALFGGEIEGIGPRYCPSIEDKVHRFADKKRHQLFIEPEGLSTEEMYIQGMSSSLPEDVQRDFYHTIEGLENIKITRPAYAIEYDCIDPTTLKPSLESKMLEGLFCAGQFNGSSGYEEAAAQGIIAGINANMEINGKEPLVLKRNEAYIGVLIDDLVTKGTNEPYRIMTSRAEYRLLLRQDNADERLTKKSFDIGLATSDRYERMLTKKMQIENELKRLKETKVTPKEVNNILERLGAGSISSKITIAELLKRPEVTYDTLTEIDIGRPELSFDIISRIEIEIKYAGYIQKQESRVRRMKKMENRSLPEDINYSEFKGLRLEAAQKLNEIKPRTLGQASRISGVSPADIDVLTVYLEKRRRENIDGKR